MRWYKSHFYNKGNNKLSNWMKTEPTTDYPSLRKNGTLFG